MKNQTKGHGKRSKWFHEENKIGKKKKEKKQQQQYQQPCLLLDSEIKLLFCAAEIPNDPLCFSNVP